MELILELMGGQQSTRNIGSELHSTRENVKYYKRKKRRQWSKDNVGYKVVEKASCNIKYISHGNLMMRVRFEKKMRVMLTQRKRREQESKRPKVRGCEKWKELSVARIELSRDKRVEQVHVASWGER